MLSNHVDLFKYNSNGSITLGTIFDEVSFGISVFLSFDIILCWFDTFHEVYCSLKQITNSLQFEEQNQLFILWEVALTI